MTATTTPRARKGEFSRSGDDRLVAGVLGGLGERLGVDPVVLRLASVPLALAGGVGVIAYLVLWAVAEQPGADVAGAPTGPKRRRPATSQQLVAVALMTLGALLLLRSTGLWFGDGIVWPVALGALGSSFLWARDGDAAVFGLRRLQATTSPSSRTANAERLDASLGDSLAQAGLVRVAAGAVLIVAGMIGFLAANDRLAALVDVGFAVVVALAGLFLVFGPWLTRLVGQLGDERRERIRSEERTAVAAHLHDSVLQTLALIQRSADQPARTVALARRQERELRAWLHGGAGHGDGDAPSTLGEALVRLATDIEDAYDVRVEVVLVGDRAIAGHAPTLLAAVREAVSNAARHAGVPVVDVYVEATEEEIEASVRDRGVGFDPEAVADDRHGIRHSVRGRLARVGGRAVLTAAPGDGVEWELAVPVSRSTSAATNAPTSHAPDDDRDED